MLVTALNLILILLSIACVLLVIVSAGSVYLLVKEFRSSGTIYFVMKINGKVVSISEYEFSQDMYQDLNHVEVVKVREVNS